MSQVPLVQEYFLDWKILDQLSFNLDYTAMPYKKGTFSKYCTRANKGRGFNSKNIIWSLALWCVASKYLFIFTTYGRTTFNAPIVGNFKGCGYYPKVSFIGAGKHYWNERILSGDNIPLQRYCNLFNLNEIGPC